jgi:tetratricopeptide (TPR) repeat protein
MEPDFAFAHFHLGRACLALGRFDEALSHLDKATGFTLTRGLAGAALAGAGRRDEARAVLEDLHRLSGKRYVASAAFALVHQGLGNVEEAVRLYAQAIDARESDLVFAAVDPVFDPVRAHPTFAASLRRGFPQLRGPGQTPPALGD